MSRPSLRKVAFLAEELALATPAQQILDRLVLGYPADGEFRHLEGCELAVHLSGPAPDPGFVAPRAAAGMRLHPDAASALRDADAAVVVPRGGGERAAEGLVRTAIGALRAEAACFVHGVIANDAARAQEIVGMAAARGVRLSAGTPTAVTWRLPDIRVPKGARITEALIVVQGEFPNAELHALDGLLPLLESRAGGETGIADLRRWDGAAVWAARDAREWPVDLLAAAVSRTDTLLGDTVLDGRTQDVVGLGLVPGLAKHPRGWGLRHKDGLRTTILVLDGVIRDFNVAIRTASGQVLSAQLYRPPTRPESHYDRLAAAIEQLMRTGAGATPDRALLTASVLARMR